MAKSANGISLLHLYWDYNNGLTDYLTDVNLPSSYLLTTDIGIIYFINCVMPIVHHMFSVDVRWYSLRRVSVGLQ